MQNQVLKSEKTIFHLFLGKTLIVVEREPARWGTGWWGVPTCACAPRGPASCRAPSHFVDGRSLGPVWVASPRLGGACFRPGAELARAPSLASPRPAPPSPGRPASPPRSRSRRVAGSATALVLSGCLLRLGQRHATRRPQPTRFPGTAAPAEKHLPVTWRPPPVSLFIIFLSIFFNLNCLLIKCSI